MAGFRLSDDAIQVNRNYALSVLAELEQVLVSVGASCDGERSECQFAAWAGTHQALAHHIGLVEQMLLQLAPTDPENVMTEEERQTAITSLREDEIAKGHLHGAAHLISQIGRVGKR